MTYLHEYKVQNDTVKVEYCFSSVTDSIKVVDMWDRDIPKMTPIVGEA